MLLSSNSQTYLWPNLWPPGWGGEAISHGREVNGVGDHIFTIESFQELGLQGTRLLVPSSLNHPYSLSLSLLVLSLFLLLLFLPLLFSLLLLLF